MGFYMHFSEIYIDNFKTLRKVKVSLNKELNVFTGTNNAGKTTILEALALWSECFRTLVIMAKKTDSKNNIRQGDYRLGTKSGIYIDHRSITSVRTSRYEDIFYEMNSSKHIVISVRLISEGSFLDIPIKIKAANGGNYLINLANHDEFNFETFNGILNLPTPFSAIYASPVAALVSDEKYVTSPQVGLQILSRKSFLVLRNRIAKLKNSVSYAIFEDDISFILSDSSQKVSFEVVGDINKDVKVNINVRFGGQRTAKDISLLGSGTLQIIELMLAIYEDRSDLNLIMLDEPDSHIHRDIQKRLIKVLVRNSLKAQVFLTTHNESLIRATDPKNIFHISSSGDGVNELEIKPITFNTPEFLRVGIQPSGKSKIIKLLGNSDSLDILDCLEADKIIFVEGESDALYIKCIYEKVRGVPLDNCVFWSLNGLDGFIESIKHYKGFLNVIASDHNLWEKAIAVFDADYITDDQRNNLKRNLKAVLGIDVFIWGEYTIEASILRNRMDYVRVIDKALTSKDIHIPRDVLKEAVKYSVDKYCGAKLIELNEDEGFQKKISGQILNRKKLWKECVGIDGVFIGGDHNILTTYQSFARPLLQDSKPFHIMTKGDLSEITNDIFNALGVEVDYTLISTFEYLLGFYYQDIDVKSWSDLANFIDRI